MTDYHHTKFGLIWSKESKVKERWGGRNPSPHQVENVLNRSGEIGLSLNTHTLAVQVVELHHSILNGREQKSDLNSKK